MRTALLALVVLGLAAAPAHAVPRARVLEAAKAGTWTASVERVKGSGSYRVVRREGRAPREVVWRSAFFRPQGVLLTSRGEVAWWADGSEWLFSEGRVEQLGRAYAPWLGPNAEPVAWTPELEDDRTIRWMEPYAKGEAMHYRDLPRNDGTGCPRRASWSKVGGNDVLEVTSSDLLDAKAFDAGAISLRACVKATGVDPVVAQGVFGNGRDEHVELVGLDRGWLAITEWDGNTRQVRLRTIDAVHRRSGRSAPIQAPRSVPSVAITDAGSAAWLTAGTDGTKRLLAIGTKGEIVELDAGALAAVRADGGFLRWTKDGEERFAWP